MASTICILWDIDGTLADSYLLGYEITLEVLSRNGKDTITQEQYHQGTKYATPNRLAWHVTGNPEDPVGIDLGYQFDDLYVDLVSDQTAGFFPGITALLHNVRTSCASNVSIKYGALSNACGAYARAVMQVNNTSDEFEACYGADDVPAPKPSAEGLLKLCSSLCVAPSRTHCVYVGDSPTDAQAAAAAGIYSVGVTWGSHAADHVRAAFDETAESVEQLGSILEAFITRSLE
jgi:phosphoglycolate phosphatase-like HAD superfamily hydrolase